MFDRRFDGSDAANRETVAPRRELRLGRTSQIATGTLACPECDAPVHPGLDPIRPAAGLGCPVCGHAAHVRDFLTLGPPLRPARVALRMVARPAVVRR
jgi:hypothetical protein